jgi:release factor glutamine methyltransferase
MTTTLRQSLSESRAVLRVGGVAEWEVEAEALLRHVLGTDRANFLTLVYGGDGLLSSTQSDRLASLLNRRLSGEPLAYIVGTREFYGLELDVNEHVLIPRQETELLVDIVMEYLPRFGPMPTVVDIGTGSGAVALAIG